jgi:hypothetical protein
MALLLVCVCVFACAVFVCCFFWGGRISCLAVVAASESKLYISLYSVDFLFSSFQKKNGMEEGKRGWWGFVPWLCFPGSFESRSIRVF